MCQNCVRKCQSGMSGWLNGTHPLIAGDLVTRTVCFARYRKTCSQKIEIQVRNCGDFFVYYLPNVKKCTMRYCGM